MKRLLLALTAVFLFSSLAVAPSASAGSIDIEAAWARATVPGASMGAAFLTIDNKGSEADRLVSAESPVASSAQLHETRNDNGVMSQSLEPFTSAPRWSNSFTIARFFSFRAYRSGVIPLSSCWFTSAPLSRKLPTEGI